MACHGTATTLQHPVTCNNNNNNNNHNHNYDTSISIAQKMHPQKENTVKREIYNTHNSDALTTVLANMFYF